MINIVIVDDHAILRRGLTQIIEENKDMKVVGEAETSAQAMRLLRELPCDVMVLDITLPDRNGIETLKLVRKEHPKLQVLMLSTLVSLHSMPVSGPRTSLRPISPWSSITSMPVDAEDTSRSTY